MKFKINSTGNDPFFYCFVLSCEFSTKSGTKMYDHFKISHNFFDFADRK